MLFKFHYTARLLLQFILVMGFLVGWRQSYTDELLNIQEYQVKAIFLLNFNKFTTYPKEAFPNSSSYINICVLGDDPFQHSLEILVQDETAQGRPFKVHYVRDIEQVDKCHTLFVSQSEQKQLTNIVNRVRQRPILTVSDIGDFVAYGGMIQFYTIDNKVRFSINPVTANEAKLQISSRLLQIAKIVKR